MTKKDKSDIDDLIEWTTISYRTIKIWGTILIVIILILGYIVLKPYLFNRNDKDRKTDKLERKAAQFIYFEGNVKVKPLSSTKWLPASEVKEIYPGDLIRTESDGRCKILFFNGTEYEVKPNSLISVLESYEELSTNKKIVGVELTNGELNLTTAKKQKKESKTKVETSNIVANIGTDTRASAKYDSKSKKTSLRISKGLAEIKSKITNKTMKLIGHQGIEASDTEIKTFEYPSSPILIYPQNEKFFNTNKPEKLSILFEWRGDEKTQKYIFYISGSRDFTNCIKKETSKERIKIKKFEYKTYYWMVKPIGENGIEGETSSIFMFSVKPKKVNPKNTIKIKYKIILNGSELKVVGKTAPDNKVRINGHNIILKNDGSFEYITIVGSNTKQVTIKMEIEDYTGAIRTIKKVVKIF